MSFEFDDYCKAWPASGHINPDDESRTCVVFSISLRVSFIYLPPGSIEDEELDITELVETEGEKRVFEVERNVLINGDEDKSRSTIQEILSSMDVPERPLMVDIILGCARSMNNNKFYADRKVLHMNVRISVVKVLEEDDDDEEDETDEETVEGPASEESIQALEIVRVVEKESQCGICLEEFSCGMEVEARRMPCSHVFHGHCIVNWLHIRKFCPLCKFELN